MNHIVDHSIAPDEKKLLMNFLCQYLGKTNAEVSWQAMPDDFFILVKELVYATNKQQQQKIVAMMDRYFQQLHHTASQTLNHLQKSAKEYQEKYQQHNERQELESLLQ